MGVAMTLIILFLYVSITYSSAVQSNDAKENVENARNFTTNTHGNSNAFRRTCTFDGRCSCIRLNNTTDMKAADCSRKGLSSIPKIGADIISIDLSHNYISTIEEYIFQDAKRLQELDLSKNNISAVLNGSFIGLKNLLTLNLSSNLLVYKDDVFGLESFRPLTNLKYLNIENNVGFYTGGQVYPTFSSLTSLETLILDGVDDEMLGTKLQNLTNLKSFRIINSSGICAIKRLPPTVFINTYNLETIDVTGCLLLKKIENGTFRHLSNLSYLDLSYNINLKFKNVQNAFDDLPFTSIKYLKINKIHGTFHLTTEVPTVLLKPLQNTSLEVLEIDSNRIQTIETGALPRLPPTLTRISAADNQFSYAPYILETRYLQITSLNISNLFATHAFTDGRILRKKRQIFSPYFDSHRTIYFPLPKTLKNLNIKRSLLRFYIPKTNISENNLEHVDFSENLVAPWIGPITNLQSLVFADFSQNFCSNVSGVFFSDMINMETLLVNNNLLGFVIPEDTKGKILGKLLKLKTLNLSQNRIASTPRLFFNSQTSLEYLDLSFNLLSNITFTLDHMKNLTFLDLSNNQIKYLSLKVQQSLETINNHNGNLTLNMENNPIVCSCDSIDFIKWLSSTNVVMKNLHDYKCSKNDGTKLDLRDPTFVYEILQKNCSQFGYLIVTGSICMFIFLIVVLGGIAYRFRWKLRYLYYISKQRYKRNNLLQNNIDDFRYDAFVSYSDNDQSFVHGEMVEQLETNFGFNLCLHKRDFVPGQAIAENITNAIHESFKTVVVISENYLKSDWCMYEFNMARMENIYSRKRENVLFLILYKTVPTTDIPLTMLELIQSDTYIEYHMENDLFWSIIKEALTM